MARTTAKTKGKGTQDAVALLKEDHEKMRDLLDELEEAAGKDGESAGQLVETIQNELKVHTTIEEEIFYPAFRDAANKKDDSKLYYEAVEHHADEEEKEMFPRAKKLFEKEELMSLGERLRQRKSELAAEDGGKGSAKASKTDEIQGAGEGDEDEDEE